MKNIIMRVVYVLAGIMFSFNMTIYLLEPIQKERDLNIVRVQSLQSCYFSAVKFAKMDINESAKFCKNHQQVTLENFEDIANQMDELTDEQYEVHNYYWNKLKKYWR